ncbi:threonine ammonia-lyase, biosynthetic [Dokdonella sp.]|uniref:threonine ammonia-lyase, biosynthetic n=1 Tax=Dokdonella sp. TaxID=2291710 RepID=UPI00261DAC9E|nr:threonine ammonia-lyase, biosynthetic [Dokdonella sp.]
MPVHDLLRRILTARVYDVARETELDFAPNLSARLDNRVFLKREDNQPVFSFKLRGAYNRMAQLSDEQRARGVFAASAGNHAQGVALAARKLGTRAVIVMPVTTPAVKIDAVRAHGGDAVEVVLAGESYSDAYRAAVELGDARGLTLIHPFDDADVIAGQGTVAMEILRQHQAPIHAIFAPVGGGGLIAGVAAYVKSVRPDIRVIGVQTEDSDAMARSLERGERVELPEVGLFSDGTAVKLAGAQTFALCREHVDEILRVDTDALCAAIKDVFADTRSLLEPAGALAVAGAKRYAERENLHGKTLVAICSGANLNFDRLRFVAERAEVGEAREALFAVTIPEERGSFRRFCALLGERSITEFNYRIGDGEKARLFVGLQTKGVGGPVGVRTRSTGENAAIAADFERAGFDVLDLTHDELAKLHLRHMVGGRSGLAADELLYRFDFPERPGALARFLAALDPAWNISLFHYRNHGADYGRILVGIQVPASDRGAFAGFLARLGYPYLDESDNPAYRLLLRA